MKKIFCDVCEEEITGKGATEVPIIEMVKETYVVDPKYIDNGVYLLPRNKKD